MLSRTGKLSDMLKFLSLGVEICHQWRPQPMTWNRVAFLKWNTLRLFFHSLFPHSLGMISLPHGIVKRLAAVGLLLFPVLGAALDFSPPCFLAWTCSHKMCFNTHNFLHFSFSSSQVIIPLWQLTGSWARAQCFTGLSQSDEYPVQSWLLFKCSNKKQSHKNKQHFHFSLDGFVFEGGEPSSVPWKTLLLYGVILERFFFFIKVPWDFSEIGPVGGIGIIIYVSAFGENLFA